MKQKLLFSKMLLCLCLLLWQVPSISQIIGTPVVTVSQTTVTVNFEVTNGQAPAAFFGSATGYTLLLARPGMSPHPIGTYYSAIAPTPVPGASVNISQVIAIPYGTIPASDYVISISADSPAAGSPVSQAFPLNALCSMPAQLNGAIKCQSPAITYYTLSITNSGTVPDQYALSLQQSQYLLGASFLSLTGNPISSTPLLNPGESYTLMMFFETPNGTPPENWNTTVVTASSSATGAQQQTNILTYIYCGNNNQNLPNAPDMEIIKTASIVNAQVGDLIDYTITIRNLTTKNAQNPVIKDFIPANAQLVSYHKNPADSRNVLFTHNPNNGTLSALVQSTMTSASMPLTIHVRVLTTCESVPAVINSAEVFSVSGDTNSANDVSSAMTLMNYSLQAAQVGRWTGNFSSDWFDCRNWSGGVVPNNSVNAYIPNGAPPTLISSLSPKAPADLTARCFDIVVNGSAELQMADAGRFAVAGNWSSQGNFIPGDGTVTFMGAQQNTWQNILDSTGEADFYNLTINSGNQAKGLGVPDAMGIIVAGSLSLQNGDIRLNGKSQLVQTADGESLNPVSGTGKLLVDQQGQSNFYSYNYWSSPVGAGNSYTVGEVLHDGTDPANPQPVNWISGYNGAPTSPISLSPFWINKYQNASGSYASWSCILQNGVLSAGQGYTMKGSGTSAQQQNYTFIGKPNNGQFTSTVSANNMNLSGNPYPCALDSHAFIQDNLTTTTGTLYFWEQFTTNSSHITANYEGGYATINLLGAAPPVAPVGISSAGSSNRTPGRYVPVGQGFLLFGSETGGTITFKNPQRAFVRESDEMSNPMFRADADKRLRINFSSPKGNVRRQLLLGYMPNEAGEGLDRGYDAEQLDTQPTDAYFPVSGKNLVIQGLGEFNHVPVPVAVRTKVEGPIKFSVEKPHGFESLFLFDSQTGQYHDLRGEEVAIFLSVGEYENRFSIRFIADDREETKSSPNALAYADASHLYIRNDGQINAVALFDLTGKLAAKWTLDNGGDVSLPHGQLVPGTYIAQLSGAGDASVKVVIP